MQNHELVNINYSSSCNDILPLIIQGMNGE